MDKSIKGEIKKYLKRTKRGAHKGDFGRIFILAGSTGLTGAAYLASMGALRSGAGLVTLGIPKSLNLMMERKLTEVMTKPLPETKVGALSKKGLKGILSFLKKQDILALGPGLSRNKETDSLIRSVVLKSTKPVVLDADGINAFEGRAKELKKVKAPLIITPHPGEFRRVFKKNVPEKLKSRKDLASKYAKSFDFFLVLKGHRTIVASPEGDVFVNTTGNPGLATGGSGDLVFGMIAAFLGQKVPPFTAAKLAVYLHGLAGDIAAKKYGEVSLAPTDVLEELPYLFKSALK